MSFLENHGKLLTARLTSMNGNQIWHLPIYQFWVQNRSANVWAHERRFVSSLTFPPDENTPIIRRSEKRDSSEKRILRYSLIVQFTCSVTHFLRAFQCLAVYVTHIIRKHKDRAWLLNRHEKHVFPFENLERAPKISKTRAPKLHI